MKAFKQFAVVLCATALLLPPAVRGAEVGTAFTYQGELFDNSAPVNGSCDFEFTLWDADGGGTQQGPTLNRSVVITEGRFTDSLDFGDVFTGEARWLQIGVCCPSPCGGFTTLNPRQELTPAPYALALPALWTQQDPTSPNIIGGHSDNGVLAGVRGATVSGGGASALGNLITDNYGVIGGGAAALAGLLWWSLPRLHPAVTALLVIGTYAGLYLLAARLLGFPEIEVWLSRLTRRLRGFRRQ